MKPCCSIGSKGCPLRMWRPCACTAPITACSTLLCAGQQARLAESLRSPLATRMISDDCMRSLLRHVGWLVTPGPKAHNVGQTDCDHPSSPPHADMHLRHHHWMCRRHKKGVQARAENQCSVHQKQHPDK